MVNQEKLLSEIKSLSDSIKRKNRALKLGINERDKFIESTFRPVIEPLKEISHKISNIAPVTEDVIGIKREIKEEEEESNEESEEEEKDTDESEYVSEKEIEDETDELTDNRPEEEKMLPSNLSVLGSDIVYKGELGRKYVVKMLHSTTANRKYHVYGARLENDGLMVGNTHLNITDNDNIDVNGKQYKGTVGLFELLFENKPSKYTKRDLAVFKKIIKDSNAHKKNYQEDSPIYRNRSIKYVSVISGLFPSKKPTLSKRKAQSYGELNKSPKKRRYTNPDTSGEGLLKNVYDTNVIYYNNINKLVERMRLLHEAMQAGHTGVKNEWVALIEELRNRGVIM